MMTRFTARRLAGLLAIAGVTNFAGFLSAQPAIGRGTGARSGKLISDCDITVESCGGDPTFDGGGGYGTGTGSTAPVCGAGTGSICKTESITRCTKWSLQTVGGNAGPTGGGGTLTKICDETVVTTWTYYWSR